jgi:hypothetical protein
MAGSVAAATYRICRAGTVGAFDAMARVFELLLVVGERPLGRAPELGRCGPWR